MKKILVAVFGHYDSRGGTTAMPLDSKAAQDGTIAAMVKEAAHKYDEDCFSWSTWGDSMPEPKDDYRPSKEDFLYVAWLHYPDTIEDLEGDLEEIGVVLAGAEPGTWGPEDDPVDLEFLPLGKSRYESEEEYNEAREKEGASASWEEWLASQAQVVTEFEEVPNWNDDAFGFMVGTGL